MKLSPIFSVGVASVIRTDVLSEARGLFDGRIELSLSPEGKVKTSLQGYDMGSNSMDKLSAYPETQVLAQAIKEEAKNYLVTVGANVDLYSIHVSNMWLNEMTSESRSPVHYHYGHTLSGCYYVDVPENSGGITFINPLSVFPKQTVIPKTLTAYNAEDCVFHPVQGELFIWESYLRHEVKATQFEGIRRCIAFDVIIKQEVL